MPKGRTVAFLTDLLRMGGNYEENREASACEHCSMDRG